jgi:hypothetical protein
VLGIAALFGAVAATVLIVLTSHGSDGARGPLRQEPTKQDQRRERGEEGVRLGTPWLATPGPSSRPVARRTVRRVWGRLKGRRHELPALRGSRRTGKPRVRRHERIPSAGSRDRAPSRRAPVAPPPVADQAPGPSLPSTPATTAEPRPTQQGETQPSAVPLSPPPPESRAVEIQIEDGELEDEPERIYAQGGHVRLRVRSDQLVVVDVEDHDTSWLVPAGGEALVEFATRSTDGFELELRRRKGVLVLRVRG